MEKNGWNEESREKGAEMSFLLLLVVVVVVVGPKSGERRRETGVSSTISASFSAPTRARVVSDTEILRLGC